MRRQQRTTLILAAVAAALLAFVWFYERNTLSSKELQERHGKLLDRFVRARLTKIEVQRHGTTFALERRRADDDETGDGPVWGLAQPVHADADDDAVSSLLGQLEWLEARRTLEGLGDADRHRMGLDHPRVRVWLTVAGERQLVAIGSDAPREEGVYAATSDRTHAYVVGKDVFEALDKDANDFRDKRLFPGTSSLRVADTLSLAGSWRLARDGTRWTFEGDLAGWASRDAVEGILGAVDDLRAARFEGESTSPEILARTHLDHPTFDLTARVPPSFSEQPDGGGAGEAGVPHPHTFRFRLGAACTGHEGERYALATRDGTDGPVVCVASTDLELLLAAPSSSLRDARVVTTENDAVDRITVASGAHRLEVHREGDGFRYTVDASHDEQGATQEGVARWLDGLRALRATEYVAISVDPHGSDHGRVALTIASEDGGDAENIVLGASDATGVWVHRADEPVSLHVGPEAEELFSASPLVLRDPRAAVCGDAENVAAMTVTREDGTRLVLARNGDRWEITSPPHTAVNDDAAHALVRLATGVEAVRWAGTRPLPRMGLDHPRALIATTATNAGETVLCTLHIGAPTAGGTYAQLETPERPGLAVPLLVIPEGVLAEVGRLVPTPTTPTPSAPVDAGAP